MHQIEFVATIAFFAGTVFGCLIMRGIRWAIVIPLAAGAICGLIAVAKAQDRTFTITIPEKQLNYIGKLLGKQTIEDGLETMQNIQSQVNAQLAREANAARDAERERIKSELSKDDKP